MATVFCRGLSARFPRDVEGMFRVTLSCASEVVEMSSDLKQIEASRDRRMSRFLCDYWTIPNPAN